MKLVHVRELRITLDILIGGRKESALIVSWISSLTMQRGSMVMPTDIW